MILISISGVTGDSLMQNYSNYFTAESFSFSVSRELADSAKGGTKDMHIGVAEMQEISVSKSSDSATIPLAKWAIAGTQIAGPVVIKFVETGTKSDGKGVHINFMTVLLDRCFVKSWSVSGDADSRPTEEVTFWFQYLALKYAQFKGDKLDTDQYGSWDHVTNKPWSDASGKHKDLFKVEMADVKESEDTGTT